MIAYIVMLLAIETFIYVFCVVYSYKASMKVAQFGHAWVVPMRYMALSFSLTVVAMTTSLVWICFSYDTFREYGLLVCALWLPIIAGVFFLKGMRMYFQTVRDYSLGIGESKVEELKACTDRVFG